MAHVLDRIPVDRITDEAREVRFGYTVLTVLAGILFGLGWLVAKGFGALWFVLAWCGTAVKVGWKSARPPQAGGDD